ncbi:MAG: hypothetical protein L0G46_11290 [Kocuria sp.]|nr:hypothetical protein [Kocuria sp.]
MSKRIETIKRLAETDPYWKGYIDGMDRTREADHAEYAEYARLVQARLDRTADPTDYDNAWVPVSNPADLGAPRVP